MLESGFCHQSRFGVYRNNDAVLVGSVQCIDKIDLIDGNHHAESPSAADAASSDVQRRLSDIVERTSATAFSLQS